MNQQFDVLIDSYLANKVGVDKSFLTNTLSKGLQQNIQQLQNDKALTSAGIGNDKLKDANQQMRSDKICWLDKTNNNAYEQEFLELADAKLTLPEKAAEAWQKKHAATRFAQWLKSRTAK